MANVEGAIRAYVLSSSTVATLISSRMYYLVAPQQEVFPYIVYQDVSDPHQATSFDQTTTRQPRFQFDVYGSSAVSVVDVRDALISALRWKQGTVGSIITEGITIANVFTMQTEDTLIFRSVVDAIVDYREG